ncbi:MAG TPA: hypothetical protein VGN80_19030 [Devosiaceae bacterium]|jgi:hypothetical protein|nr:hypothetical protein [Devosiaceae bacterium]
MSTLGPLLFGTGALLAFGALLAWVWWRQVYGPRGADDYPHEIGDGS